MPVGRRRLKLGALSPDEFELLCYLVIEIEHREAVHIADPDGGVDVGLPRPDRTWERCWQAKRFTSSISWPKCVASLDAAVVAYEMPHYTFCFAKDLTHNQELSFKNHLVGRYEDVVVDYWGQSKLEALLFSTAQGERIANAFYGDTATNTRAIMRAIRAQGPLESGGDVLDRLGAIAEYLERRDPFYSYAVVANEVDAPAPPLTPGTIVSARSDEGGIVRRIDAVVRSSAALENPPSGTIYLAPEQVQEFSRFLTEGGELRFDNIGLELRNMPPGLPQPAQIPPEQRGWTVALRSNRRSSPAPWNARFVVKTPEGVSLTEEIALLPSHSPADWDGALAGGAEGLRVEILLRVRDGLGQMQIHWSYTDLPESSTASRARMLRFVEALHSGGSLLVEDIDNVRPPLELTPPQHELDPQLSFMRRYVEDVLVLEQWLGHELPRPDEVPANEVQAIHQAASIIRRGGSEMTVGDISMSVPQQHLDDMHGDKPLQFLLEQEFGLAVLGTEFTVGQLRGILNDLEIETDGVELDEDGQELVRIRLRPTTEETRHPFFSLLRRVDSSAPGVAA